MATPKKTKEELKITYGNVTQTRGRPSNYSDSMPDTVRNYIEDCKNSDTFPTVAGLAYNIGITKDTIYRWAEIHPELSDALKALKDYQELTLVENTLNKRYSDRFAQFFAVNCLGYSNKAEITANVATVSVEGLLKDANGDKF